VLETHLSLSRLKNYQGLMCYNVLSTVNNILIINSSIIHEEKTKEITAVSRGFICDKNYANLNKL
jgi:hypothetical protein